MRKPEVRIDIECGAKCGVPLNILRSYYLRKKSWGQKIFYHATCKRSNIQLVRTPRKDTTGGIYAERWKRK